MLMELCKEIRNTEPFCQNGSLKKLVFNDCYIPRVMRDQGLRFSGAKSNQIPISEERLHELRETMNLKLQNYKPTHALKLDESGFCFKDQGGRIIVKEKVQN